MLGFQTLYLQFLVFGCITKKFIQLINLLRQNKKDNTKVLPQKSLREISLLIFGKLKNLFTYAFRTYEQLLVQMHLRCLKS